MGATTAESQGVTPLRRDRDFECIAAVTGRRSSGTGLKPQTSQGRSH
ncbi:hypothetical protein OG920_24260 [Streptomyces europaeiscabiei]